MARIFNPVFFALIFGVIAIASAYVFAKSRTNEQQVVDTSDGTVATTTAEHLYDTVRGLQSTDHIFGNPGADILFYVYTDFGCEYCRQYHETLKTVMKLYGSTGRVAIVLRHMPFVQLHPESPMYALATECAAKEGGNTAFWKLVDLLFEKGDPLDPLNASELVVLAENAGVPKQSFVACMRSNELMANVERDFQEGMSAGAQGTPFTVFEANGQRATIEGAQTYRSLALMLQTIIRTTDIEGEVHSPMDAVDNGTFTNDFFLYENNATTTASTSSSTAAQ